MLRFLCDACTCLVACRTSHAPTPLCFFSGVWHSCISGWVASRLLLTLRVCAVGLCCGSDSITEKVTTAGLDNGRFLVRTRDGKHGEFVICVVYKGKPTHHLAAPDDSGQIMVNKKGYGCSDIVSLVKKLGSKQPNWPVPLDKPVNAPGGGGGGGGGAKKKAAKGKVKKPGYIHDKLSREDAEGMCIGISCHGCGASPAWWAVGCVVPVQVRLGRMWTRDVRMWAGGRADRAWTRACVRACARITYVSWGVETPKKTLEHLGLNVDRSLCARTLPFMVL